jgi:hypothetical protein
MKKALFRVFACLWHKPAFDYIIWIENRPACPAPHSAGSPFLQPTLHRGYDYESKASARKGLCGLRDRACLRLRTVHVRHGNRRQHSFQTGSIRLPNARGTLSHRRARHPAAVRRAAILSKQLIRQFGYLAAAVVILLAGAQLIAVATGLANGTTPATGWQFALVVGLIALFDLLIVVIGVVGVIFAARLFHKPAVDDALTAIESLEEADKAEEAKPDK